MLLKVSWSGVDVTLPIIVDKKWKEQRIDPKEIKIRDWEFL